MAPELGEMSDTFLILYASQTGNAEWIAKNIHSEALQRGFQGDVIVMNDYEKVDLSKERTLILVTSNTGDGDPPDNSSKFWKFFRRIKDKSFFSCTRYAILGLGDTNYSNFNNSAKKLDKKLKECGGLEFYAKGLADDAEGLENVVDPWIAELWTSLQTVCKRAPQPNADSANTLTESTEKSLAEITKKFPEATTLASSNFVGMPENLMSVVEKYASIPNSLLSSDTKKMPSPVQLAQRSIKPYPIHIDTSALDSAKELTGLPRIPAPVCKISTSPMVTSSAASNLLVPSFIKTPNPVMDATLRSARCLTAPGALKRALFLELALPVDQEVQFEPGDSFAIIAPNDEELVLAIFQALDIDEQEARKNLISVEAVSENEVLPTHLQDMHDTTLFEIFQYALDLTIAPRKALFRLLAEYTSDAEEKRKLLFLCSKQGASEFNSLRDQAPNLLDILASFPHTKPPPVRLLDILPPHQARSYSICNSPLSSPRSFTFAFNVVAYNTPAPYNVPRKGVATPWLDTLAGGITTLSENPIVFPEEEVAKIPLFLRPNINAFTLPSDTSRPLILIGPGTGVAPFIGFLQHRQTQRDIRRKLGGIGARPTRAVDIQFGDVVLYFGCRDRNKDFLFQKELETFVTAGVLKKLEVAVSREAGIDMNDKPKYVQNLLRRNATEVYRTLVERNGCVYVCGDAKGMAKDVHAALTDILVEKGEMDKVEAGKTLAEWIEQRKYLRDLW